MRCNRHLALAGVILRFQLGPRLWKPYQRRASGSAPMILSCLSLSRTLGQGRGCTTVGPPANGRCLYACAWGRRLRSRGTGDRLSKWTWRPADHSKPTSKLHRVPEASEESWWFSQWQALTRAAKILGRCDDPGSATERLGWTWMDYGLCKPQLAYHRSNTHTTSQFR